MIGLCREIAYVFIIGQRKHRSTVHLHKLIGAFVVHCLKGTPAPKIYVSYIWLSILLSKQTDLDLDPIDRLSHDGTLSMDT